MVLVMNNKCDTSQICFCRDVYSRLSGKAKTCIINEMIICYKQMYCSSIVILTMNGYITNVSVFWNKTALGVSYNLFE